ncbi:hypothetical protein BD779DRAFT_1473520 [Infundibulicybe gibba]|nr:hypothetical protein BD779DRAFT_1473520 [Infundibulicybe gibba]
MPYHNTPDHSPNLRTFWNRNTSVLSLVAPTPGFMPIDGVWHGQSIAKLDRVLVCVKDAEGCKCQRCGVSANATTQTEAEDKWHTGFPMEVWVPSKPLAPLNVLPLQLFFDDLTPPPKDRPHPQKERPAPEPLEICRTKFWFWASGEAIWHHPPKVYGQEGQNGITRSPALTSIMIIIIVRVQSVLMIFYNIRPSRSGINSESEPRGIRCRASLSPIYKPVGTSISPREITNHLILSVARAQGVRLYMSRLPPTEAQCGKESAAGRLQFETAWNLSAWMG